MSGTLVRANNNFTAGPTSSAGATFGAAVGVAHLVDVWVTWSNNTSGGANNISQIKDDKNNVYNLVDVVWDAGSNTGLQSAYLEGINNAPITITVTFTDTNPANILVYIQEYAGLVTSNAIDGHTISNPAQSGPGTGVDAVTSGNATTTANGDLISSGSIAFTVGSPLVHGTGFTDANVGATEYKTQAAHGAVAGTWTFSSGGTDVVATGVMAFKADIFDMNSRGLMMLP